MDDMLTRTAHQRRVDEFMRKAGQELPIKPTLPDEKTRMLRAKLILEEVMETVKELGFDIEVNGLDISSKKGFKEFVVFSPNPDNANLVGIADGCADIMVVTTGTLSACGIANDRLQFEVDVNNLAKFEHRCPKCGRADQVTHNLNKGDGWVFCTACNAEWQSGHHNEAGKWVKPANHKPPRIAEVLAEQTKAAEAAEAKTVEMQSFTNPANDPECFGEDFLPSEKRCQSCPNPRKERCLNIFIGA